MLPILLIVGGVIAFQNGVLDGVLGGGHELIEAGETQVLVAGDAAAVVKRCTPEQLTVERLCDDRRVLLVNAAKMPFIARNTKLAWGDGHPGILTMNRGKQAANRAAACPRSFARPHGGSCDEYPMASTDQGGAGARAEEVPQRENQCQGGSYGAQYPKRWRRISRRHHPSEQHCDHLVHGAGYREGARRVLGQPGAMDGVADQYAWVDQIEAWTVAVVHGRTADEVLRIYGGDPASPVGDYPFAQMADLQGDGGAELTFHVQLLEVASRVVVIENNGWSGSLPEIARRCSADGGDFFSVYWNVNAFGMVTAATDGRVTAHFEHLYPFAPQAEPHEVRPDWAVGPEVDVEVARRVCFALLEQQTGVLFEAGWLAEPRPTYRVPDPHWLYREVDGADQS